MDAGFEISPAEPAALEDSPHGVGRSFFPIFSFFAPPYRVF
jgi:hypothetical protein